MFIFKKSMSCSCHVNTTVLRTLGLWEEGVSYEPREAPARDVTRLNPNFIRINILKEAYSAPYISAITYSTIHTNAEPVIFYTSPMYAVETSYKEWKQRALNRHMYPSRILKASAARSTRLEFANTQWKIVERGAESTSPALRGTEDEVEDELNHLALQMDDAARLYYRVYLQRRHIPEYFGRQFIERKISCIRRQQGRILPQCYTAKAVHNFSERYLRYGVKVQDASLAMPWSERFKLMLGQNCCVMKSAIHGHGLFAVSYIPRGRNVIEYVGEIVNREQANVRERQLSANGFTSTYLFSITANQEIVVDATFIGNAARFANHSCLPNCEAHVVENRLYLRALEDILPGDELCYDYHLRQTEGDRRLQCFCRAPNCRGFMDM